MCWSPIPVHETILPLIKLRKLYKEVMKSYEYSSKAITKRNEVESPWKDKLDHILSQGRNSL